jgi:hypothetical protein
MTMNYLVPHIVWKKSQKKAYDLKKIDIREILSDCEMF